MKKILLAVTVVFLTICVNAQVKLGVKAGLNIANQKYSTSMGSASPKSLVGFHAGLIADMSLSENFAIQPGLLFSQKGSKTDFDGDTETTKLNYLDLPINAVLKLDAGSAKVLLMAGPSFSYAISGKYKSGDESEDVKFGSNDGECKRLDMGLGFGAGVQISNFLLTVNYSLGLANIANAGPLDVKLKNNVLGISVGYLFGK